MSSALAEMLGGLHAELFCYLEDGPVKSKLHERYQEEADAHADILEFDHNASLRVTRGDGSAPARVTCRLEANDLHYQVDFAAGDFTADEVSELIELLQPLCPVSAKPAAGPGRNILRKNQGRGLLNISAAAKILGLSQRSLKSLIPCSETRIVEEGGNKSIKEFYWDRRLIDRLDQLWLKQQQGRGYDSEDLAFIAERCCDGDRQWARDCIDAYLQQRKLTETRL